MNELLAFLARQADAVRGALPGGAWPVWLALLSPLTAGVVTAVGSRARTGLGRRAALLVAAVGALGALVGTTAATLGSRSVDLPWAPALGIRLHLALDHVSAPLALSACFAALVSAVLVGRDDMDDTNGNEAGLHTLSLALLTGSLSVLLARDAVLLAMATTAAVAPAWALVHAFGAAPAERVRPVASRVSGSLGAGAVLVLAGTLVLTAAAGTSDLGGLRAGLAGAPRSELLAGTVLVALGCVVLVPLFPGHAWWPEAARLVPPPVGVTLAGAVLPLGGYLVARLVVAPSPEAARLVTPWLAALAAFSVLWFALVAIAEHDVARAFALIIAAQLAAAVLGLASGTALGVQAGALGLLSASLGGTAALTALAALRRAWGVTGTQHTREPLRIAAPRLGRLFVTATLVAVGVPGTLGFWGAMATLVALAEPEAHRGLPFVAAGAYGLGMLLVLAAGVRLVGRIWSSGWFPQEDVTRTVVLPTPMPDKPGPSRLPVAAVAVVVVALGLVPSPVVRVAAHAAAELLGVS